MQRSKLIVALLLSVSSAAAYAGGSTWSGANVTNITSYPTGGPAGKGYVVVTFSSNGAGTPSCASGYPRNVAIDISTPGGAFAAAASQTAMLTGMVVTVIGTGTCSVVPTAETLASIQTTGH